MRGEKDLEGFEQGRGLPGSLQDLGDLFLVFFSDGGNDFVLVSKITIDEADADAGFGADVVHGGLVKTRFGKADNGRVEDLPATIISGFAALARSGSRSTSVRARVREAADDGMARSSGASADATSPGHSR